MKLSLPADVPQEKPDLLVIYIDIFNKEIASNCFF